MKQVALTLLFASLAAAQTVRITWVGQACFYVQTENGPTVVVDPPVASVGYTLPTAAADVVTMSHDHTDHNNAAGVRGTPARVDGRNATQRTEMSASGLPFVVIPGFHDNTNGSARGRNSIVQWTQGGLRFAHMGDYGQDALTSEQLADLKDIDVLMVPGGGFFTVEPTQLNRVLDAVKPRVAILMHFRTALGGPAQLATLPAITTPFPAIRYKPSTVALTRAALPAASEVWIMEPAAEAAVVHSAGFTGGAPLAPGSLASIFGAFTNSATAQYSGTPLPRKLGDTEVFIGNTAVPLLYASPTQVNFQVPAALAAGQSAIEVRIGGQRISRGTLTVLPRSPALFVAADQDGRINRVRRGGFLTIYGGGQGAISPALADGALTPDDPLSSTADLPSVVLGTRTFRATFSGMTPRFIGLWQVNVQIPEDVVPGTDLDLAVYFDANLPSNKLKITVD